MVVSAQRQFKDIFFCKTLVDFGEAKVKEATSKTYDTD